MKISLIMPVYNEGKIIKNTLEKLNSFLKKDKNEWEIVIINDGSTDNTLEILENFKPRFFRIVSYEKNKGKGFAIKKGVETASKEYIGFMDSDMAYSFENLIEMAKDLENYEIVMGTRDPSGNPTYQNRVRKFLGKRFRKISDLILGYELGDTQCGIKAFRKEVAKDLFSKQRMNGWSFDAEILYIAKKRDYKIKKARAIVQEYHSEKESRMNLLKDPPKMFLDLLKIRLNNMQKKYEKDTSKL